MAERKYKFLTTIDGCNYYFYQMQFKKIFDEYVADKKEQGKYTKQELHNLIAEKTNMTSDSVKQWYMGYCGPGDLGIVKNIADVLGIDYMNLLIPEDKKEHKMSTDNFTYSLSEKEVIKKVYDMILTYCDMRIAFINGDPIPNYEEARDPNQRLQAFVNYIEIMHNYVDRSALDVSEETWEKLHKILLQVSFDRDIYYDDEWDDLNPDFCNIRFIYAYDEPYGMFYEDEIDDIVRNMQIKLAADIKSDQKDDENLDIVFGRFFKNEYLYRYEYTKVITRVFRKRFPDMF